MDKLKGISDDELLNYVKKLESKAKGLRANILKECDDLEVMYRELIAIKEEMEARKAKLNGEDK